MCTIGISVPYYHRLNLSVNQSATKLISQYFKVSTDLSETFRKSLANANLKIICRPSGFHVICDQ